MRKEVRHLPDGCHGSLVDGLDIPKSRNVRHVDVVTCDPMGRYVNGARRKRFHGPCHRSNHLRAKVDGRKGTKGVQ